MSIFYKRNKRHVPRTLLSYISTWELIRTLEKFEKVSPTAHASLSTYVVFLKKYPPASTLQCTRRVYFAFIIIQLTVM